jgi:hypothetical protein
LSKLFKLKEWVTIEEAAAHISNLLGEPATEADIYRFALDGYIKISANFINHAQARLGKFVSTDDVDFVLVETSILTGDKMDIPYQMPVNCETRVSKDLWISLEREVRSISGIWDLTMCGAESLDIEHSYQQLTTGLEITLVALDGVFVEKGEIVAQLQTSFDDNEYQKGSTAQKNDISRYLASNSITEEESKDVWDQYKIDRKEFLDQQKSKTKENRYFPSGGLDEQDYVLVVRTKELTRFIQSLDDSTVSNRPLTSKERNSLLVLIGALCSELEIDPSQRGVATSLELMTQKIGAPLTDDTIRKVLNQINEAVEARNK